MEITQLVFLAPEKTRKNVQVLETQAVVRKAASNSHHQVKSHYQTLSKSLQDI